MSYIVTSADVSDITLNESDHVKEVLQNVAMILTTRRGTIPLYRDFGLSQAFMDKPVNIAMPLLVAEITEAVETYEPRAEITDITFSTDATGRLIPSLEVNIIG